MLIDWEAETRRYGALGENEQLVYAGFDVTYKRISSDFDKIYYESQTYLLKGPGMGTEENVFFRKEDGRYGST
jgi:arginyl-tRNA synthetase